MCGPGGEAGRASRERSSGAPSVVGANTRRPLRIVFSATHLLNPLDSGADRRENGKQAASLSLRF